MSQVFFFLTNDNWSEPNVSLSLLLIYSALSGPHILYSTCGPCGPRDPQSNVDQVHLTCIVSLAVLHGFSGLCSWFHSCVGELLWVHIKIQPLVRYDAHVIQTMLGSFKTTTRYHLTNKAEEADSVSSQLTAPPPPPLLPLLLFHCVNMTEPPLVIWSWRQMELVSVTSAAQQDKWASSSHWWNK